MISYLLLVWRRVEKLASCSSGWGPHSPIFNNDRLLIGGQHICFPDWERKNICTLNDIFEEKELLFFQNICIKYSIMHTSFFFYLQLRSTLKNNGISLQSPLVTHPICKMFDSARSTSGFVSRLYWLVYSSYRPLALDKTWRKDIPNLKDTFDWDRVWVDASLASRNADHQQMHYNYIRGILYS